VFFESLPPTFVMAYLLMGQTEAGPCFLAPGEARFRTSHRPFMPRPFAFASFW
jgi:hypothetical protein